MKNIRVFNVVANLPEELSGLRTLAFNLWWSWDAEAIEIVFDPALVTYEKLLAVFWENHDPTTLNRQGPDVGSQYRSAIFFHSDAQKAAALAAIAALTKEKRFPKPIVTELVPVGEFWPAEEYHQKYFMKKGGGSCNVH